MAADRQRALTLGVAEGAEARGDAGLHGWWASPGVDLRATVPAGRVFLGGWAPEGGATVAMLGITAAAATPLVLGLVVQRVVIPKVQGSPWYLPLQTVTWAAFAATMFFFGRMSAMDFIYFQF